MEQFRQAEQENRLSLYKEIFAAALVRLETATNIVLSAPNTERELLVITVSPSRLTGDPTTFTLQIDNTFSSTATSQIITAARIAFDTNAIGSACVLNTILSTPTLYENSRALHTLLEAIRSWSSTDN